MQALTNWSDPEMKEIPKSLFVNWFLSSGKSEMISSTGSK